MPLELEMLNNPHNFTNVINYLRRENPWRDPLFHQSAQQSQQESPINHSGCAGRWWYQGIFCWLRQKILRQYFVFIFLLFTFASFSTLSNVELSKKICTTWRSKGFLAAENLTKSFNGPLEWKFSWTFITRRGGSSHELRSECETRQTNDRTWVR